MYTERGNILFLILLAVVLFAALSYAVTNSLRGGGKDATTEKANSFAAQLIQIGGLTENTINRAMLMSNIPDYGFDLSGNNSNATTNATCTSSVCQIFQNGQIALPAIPDWASADPTNTPNKRMAFLGAGSIMNVGTSAPDLYIFYKFLTRPVCDAINRLMGYTDIALVSETAAGSNYTGTLAAFPASSGIIGDEDATLVGKPAFCYYIGAANRYDFLYVILAR